jgi:DNA-binding transcriptional ArsR family regulator
MRPWNVMGADGPDLIVCYPVSDETLAADPGAPPPQLLRFHRALGDEKRLRILQRLAAADGATLQELADAAGVAKSTAHHHLALLRDAGFVGLRGNARAYRYFLHEDALTKSRNLLAAVLTPRNR